MSRPAFSLNLGNGVYMDSEGKLHDSPVPNAPVYEAPFSLPVDPKKVKEALTSVKDALTDINKKGFVHERWGKVDEIDKILDIVAGVGKLAGYVAPVAAAIGIIVDVVTLFLDLDEERSAVEAAVDAHMNDLKSRVAALLQLMQSQLMVETRSGIGTLRHAVVNHLDRLKDADPSPEDLKRAFDILLTAHNTEGEHFLVATDRQTWMADFRRSEHTLVWPMLSGVLHVVPGVAAGTTGGGSGTRPVTMPNDGLNFDHRLMFPFVSFAIGSYLTCIRGTSREYRTTGEFRAQLRTFATRLAELANAMRETVLARTIYTADHFNQVFYENGGYLRIPHASAMVGPLAVEIPLAPEITPDCSYWPVGAMDLRYHDDAYFQQFLADLAAADFKVWSQPDQASAPVTKIGTLNLRWIPPAKLVPGGGPNNWVIANREECAAAANAQSETDYANLLSISGYPELMRLSVLCRNEATAPQVSQTVKPERPSLFVNPQRETDVTVKSNPVRYTGEVISTTARRASQDFFAKVSVATQTVKRADPLKYRVVLRTLHSLSGTNGWRDVKYSDHQLCSYENDPDNPGFKRLRIAHATGGNDHPLVSEPTGSPRNLVHLEGTATLKATTFDWWVPTKPPAPTDDFIDHLRNTIIDPWRETARNYELPDLAMPLIDPVFGDGTRPGPSIAEFTWPRPNIPEDSQRREVRQETVHLHYAFDWNREQLQLKVWNEPSERNYVVYLVLEEHMSDGSGNILHTAIELPVCGLITRVPEQFFIDEFTAHAKTAKIIAGLIPKYIPGFDDIGPNDGGVAWIRPGDLISPQGVERVMARIETENPTLFKEILSVLQRNERVGRVVL